MRYILNGIVKTIAIVYCFANCQPTWAMTCRDLFVDATGVKFISLKEGEGASGNLVSLAIDSRTRAPLYVQKIYPTAAKAAKDYHALSFLKNLKLKSLDVVDVLELSGPIMKTHFEDQELVDVALKGPNANAISAEFERTLDLLMATVKRDFPESVIERRPRSLIMQVVLPDHLIPQYGGNWLLLIWMNPTNVTLNSSLTGFTVIDPH
jgi:hypothetical protein